jgi:hypothetical protein
MVAARGAKVVLEVQPALKSLLASLEGVHRILGKGEALPPFDFHCPLMSLPRAFGTVAETIPAPIPYLRPDPARVQYWQGRLGEKRGLRVGLAWTATKLSDFGREKSVPLREFARMARQDPSPLVRLYLASGLQRVSAEKRWDVLAGLLANADDATDQNLPWMVWYAAEPVVALDMSRALGAALDSKLPRLFAFTVQRIAAIGTQEALRVLTDRLGRTAQALRTLYVPGAAGSGDLNGSGAVDMGDVALALRMAGGLMAANPRAVAAGDVRPKPGVSGPYGDGRLLLVDALAMARKAADPNAPFP